MSPIWVGTSPCWIAGCDGCGRHSRHFDTKQEMRDRLEAAGWHFGRKRGEDIYCAECAERTFGRMRELREAWER